MASPPVPLPVSAVGATGATAFLDAPALLLLLPFSSLIPHLRSALPSITTAVHAPPRLCFPLPSSPSASLLLMSSWSADRSLPYLGVKIVTSFPNNSASGLPGIHATYSLFDAANGIPLVALDGSQLTLLRTAAVSALAASLLARDDARVLVMVGAGALAPYLVAAHRLVRPGINRVIVWNRTPDKARILAGKLREAEEESCLEGKGATFEHAVCLDEVVGLGDVVSCATSSESPIVRGEKLKPGAHLDLVGSFSPAMRECDDEAMARGRGRVFVDFEVAMDEAGELVGAFERGVLQREDVTGTLVELVSGTKVGRRNFNEVTVFKSVGTAVVDLLAAQLAYETFRRDRV